MAAVSKSTGQPAPGELVAYIDGGSRGNPTQVSRTTEPMKSVTLITDGACIGNPGPGGWACLLRYDKRSRELYGSAPDTTNNRMELMAVREGLSALKEPCKVTIVTDSEYVHKGVTEWMDGWKQKGWRTTDKKKPVKNQDLWKALDEALARHSVSWQWVKGHGSHADNIRVDKVAYDAARLQSHSTVGTRV